jgi:hypothetical protein
VVRLAVAVVQKQQHGLNVAYCSIALQRNQTAAKKHNALQPPNATC